MADLDRVADVSPLSLLYPDAEAGARSGAGGLTRDTWEQLEGDVLLDLHGADPGDYFSDDPDVIAYRQEVFRDLSERKTVTIARDARKKLMKDDRSVLEAADEADLEEDEEYEKLTEAEKEKEDAEAARKRDIVLTEAFNILADVAAMTDGGEAPPPPPPPVNRLPAWLQAIQRGVEP